MLAVGVQRGRFLGKAGGLKLSSVSFLVGLSQWRQINSSSNSENSPGSLRKQWKVINIGSVPINISGVLLAVIRNFHNSALEDLST